MEYALFPLRIGLPCALHSGNAAFETADALYGVTSSVHLVSRSRARLAWSTHYVGDLR